MSNKQDNNQDSPTCTGLGMGLNDLSAIEVENSIDLKQNAAFEVLNVIEQHCSQDQSPNNFSRSEEKNLAFLHRNMMPSHLV